MLILARALVTTVVAISTTSCLGVSPEHPVKTYDARTFYETTTYFGSSFSADETRLLVTSDKSGVFNLYSQPVGGGEPTQLTHSTSNAIFGIGWFPEDDRALYRADQGGNELHHIYVLLPSGNAIDITPGDGHRAGFGGWAGDFESFYVTTNERDRKAMDLYRYDATSYERSMVFLNDGGYSIAGMSRDGRWLALAQIENNANDNLYIKDLTTDAAPRLITEHEGNVSHGSHGFSPDGRWFFYTSNEDSEFAQLWGLEVATGARKIMRQADWDVTSSRLSWTGRYRVTSINADAHTVIDVRDERSGTAVELPELPNGDITNLRFSRSERLMTFSVNGDTSPSNLYVLDLESGDLRRLTNALNPEIDETHLVQSTVIRYPSFDDLEIPALLWKPHQASPTNRVPALVWVHGGPGGQSRAGYRAELQFLINHGYAILAVNNRGSSGYGKTFFHLDDQRHGEDDLQDCIHGRRYLETLDWVDTDRIGIIGGSYGGYMVAAALAFEPEAFDVGINIFGVTNWLRTLKSIPPWWESFRDALFAEMGNPDTDEERLRRISPLFHAENIVKPLLVVQGANDPRVLQVESDEIVDAVRRNGVPVEYVLFDDEGHGFTNKVNRITAAEAYLSFLDRYLR